jgi:O-antigen/teichoic acid export membrane protein
VTTAPSRGLGSRLGRLRSSRLVRQNLVLFIGGLVAGVGGFVYHAVAGHLMGPRLYGDVASLIALYAVLIAPYYILILVLARYAATRAAAGSASVRYLISRATQVTILPSLVILALGALLAGLVADFLHLHQATPVVWLAAGVAVVWQVAIPRGILQGIQSFGWLSANLSMEMVVRCVALVVLLIAGTGVDGAAAAVLAGALFSYGLGMIPLRDRMRETSERTPLRSMLGFSATAAAGTLGILLLYNLDVILAKHFLTDHDAGIYGGLNKIGTILYFLTLSVSQVLFPRVVEAIATNNHPGRLLAYSAGIIALLGVAALVVFLVVPGLIVRILFGAQFAPAIPFVFPIGVFGLALALNNLLVQFFMAAHDRWFVPVLAGGVVVLAAGISLSHANLGAVVADVVATMLVLLVGLGSRLLLLLPRLRPVADAGVVSA